MNFSTHIVDELSFQETDRFQCQQMVHKEGVGVFQSTDDTPKEEEDTCKYCMCWGSTQRRKIKAGHLCTYEHQRVPVKRCLLCNSPAAPPLPLLQLHCQATWCCWKSFTWALYHSHISACITKPFNHLFPNCGLPFLAVHQCFIYQPQKCVFFLCG